MNIQKNLLCNQNKLSNQFHHNKHLMPIVISSHPQLPYTN